MTTDELVPALDAADRPFLLDVREPDEFADWVIPGAVNIPLGQLAERLGELPREQKIVTVCARGARALQGAEILAEHGLAATVLDGGMGAWGSTYDTVEGDFAGARVIQLRRRGKGCLSYVIGAGDTAVVIDPSLDVVRYEALAASHGWRIRHIVDTHLHADHISGGRALAEATGATLHLSPHDPFAYEFTPLSDGEDLALADGVELSVSAISAPGHTEGSTIYRLGDAAIFTGDTLFLESVGRPDLAEQAEPFAHSLYRSLHERILPMDDAVMVFPAHYGDVVPVTSGVFVAQPLGALRRNLAALTLSETDFVAWAVKSVKDRPPNYQRIVLMNAGHEPITAEAAELESGPNRCAIA